ncbi:hypothetical protein TanjilG_04920 [Lupinus angustifolius]|uniref:Large ribosomal subunit protein uL2 C-terminal domain-containing protein n=1 Tax=Lupinus angustifolius TaxID=3871 RepID=A0A1J7H5V7_LUPAN|nr:hypothetical protein TanjilG_04920 [Lupinus angustifolius]
MPYHAVSTLPVVEDALTEIRLWKFGGLRCYPKKESYVANTNPHNPRKSIMNQMMYSDTNSQIGSSMPLSSMRIGTIIHTIELNPGQGGKLVQAAGTNAKILKDPTAAYLSNPSHGDRKLRKAGHSRWLGRRPVVRGVAMNPVDHPRGGGEGKSKSSGKFGKGSRTPWGKPTKGGYKTGPLKRRR